jgi:type II secretory pathway pseudopilin PulG
LSITGEMEMHASYLKKYIKNKKRNLMGFSLVEIVLVVGFIALASIGIYTIYTKVSSTYLAQNESRQMSAIATSALQLMSASNNPVTVDATFLVNAGIIPAGSVTSGTYISAMGSPVVFSSVYTSNVGEFQIAYSAMITEYCMKLVSAYQPNADYISVAGTVVQNTNPMSTNVPYNPATATVVCATANSFPMIVQLRH